MFAIYEPATRPYTIRLRLGCREAFTLARPVQPRHGVPIRLCPAGVTAAATRLERVSFGSGGSSPSQGTILRGRQLGASGLCQRTPDRFETVRPLHFDLVARVARQPPAKRFLHWCNSSQDLQSMRDTVACAGLPSRAARIRLSHPAPNANPTSRCRATSAENAGVIAPLT